MNNLDELKAIWHSAKTDNLPNSKEMLLLIRKFRSQKLRRKWLIIVSSSLLSCLMIVILLITPFKLFTTYVGGTLIFAGGILMAVNEIKSLKRFYQLSDCSNLDFVAFIEQTRQNQIYYYKKTMVIIVLLNSVGLTIYIYEPAHKFPLLSIGVYAGFLIYQAIMWFIVRPRNFKKNADKLDAVKQRLESISKQLK